MREVVVVSAVPTAIGTCGGSLKDLPPTQLGAMVVREALARAKVDGGEVGHVALVDAVLDEAAKFATGILDPLYRAGDREGARLEGHRVVLPDAVAAAYAKFVAGGWNGLEGPVEHGGQGLPHLIAGAVQELWNGADMAFHLCPMLTSRVVEALLHHGSAEQRRAYLP